MSPVFNRVVCKVEITGDCRPGHDIHSDKMKELPSMTQYTKKEKIKKGVFGHMSTGPCQLFKNSSVGIILVYGFYLHSFLL